MNGVGFAIIVITMCSLRLNFPGFRLHVYLKVVNRLDGRIASKSLPAGKARSWATLAETVIPG